MKLPAGYLLLCDQHCYLIRVGNRDWGGITVRGRTIDRHVGLEAHRVLHKLTGTLMGHNGTEIDKIETKAA